MTTARHTAVTNIQALTDVEFRYSAVWPLGQKKKITLSFSHLLFLWKTVTQVIDAYLRF